MSRRAAIVGAGPVGLEMALVLTDAGLEVQVYEAGSVGGHLASVGDVPLFTPFAMNSTAETRDRLRAAGADLPDDDVAMTARELVARYLEPVAALGSLRGRIETGACVLAVGRDDLAKTKEIAATGATGRSARPFLLRVRTASGERLDPADIVIDASGTLSNPLATGPGGIGAVGEDRLGDKVDRRLLPTRDAHRARFQGRRVLLVGSGHSAATALLELDALAREGAGPARVDWVHRDRGTGPVFEDRRDDPLPARSALGREANAVASRAPWIGRYPGRAILAYEAGAAGSILARLRPPAGPSESIEVDRVYALVGYRPDLEMARELQVHLCYASEGPMALASALLTAGGAGGAPADCLAQTTHGPETLRNPEPDFFVIGAKSYARNPGFLLRVGYEQVREVALLLACAVPVTG